MKGLIVVLIAVLCLGLAHAQSANARITAMRFAEANGFEIPHSNLTVVVDWEFTLAHKPLITASHEERESQAQELARAIAPNTTIGWSDELLRKRMSIVAPSGSRTVLLVTDPEIVGDGTAKVMIALYTPPAPNSGTDGRLRETVVQIRRDGSSWRGDKFSFPMFEKDIKLPPP